MEDSSLVNQSVYERTYEIMNDFKSIVIKRLLQQTFFIKLFPDYLFLFMALSQQMVDF